MTEPIAVTVYSWPVITKRAKAEEGRSITGVVDSESNLNDIQKCLGFLGAFGGNQKKVRDLIRDKDKSLRFLCLGYICILTDSEQVEIVSSTNLRILKSNRRLSIVFGDLIDLGDACFTLTKQTNSVDLREIFNEIANHLISNGLLVDYRKRMLSDNTFILEETK